MEKNNFVERNKETTEMWSKIVGHKEKKQRTKKNKEDRNKIKNREPVKEIVRKKRLLKMTVMTPRRWSSQPGMKTSHTLKCLDKTEHQIKRGGNELILY